jgi:ribulose-phosphate 3-epimerase
MITIFPSLMAHNSTNLEPIIKQLEPYCDGFHIDLMDGQFVPNSYGDTNLVNTIAKLTNRTLFVHLMVKNPEQYISNMKLRPRDIIAFHTQTTTNPQELINLIKKRNLIPALAINPQTDIASVYPYLDELGIVLIMGVEPGFSGQTLEPQTIEKIGLLKSQKNNITIAFDGGISQDNIATLARKGVSYFCIGSAIFKGKDPIENLKKLRALATH